MDSETALVETETIAAAPETVASELAIEYLPIETLVPYARNARTHSEEQVRQLMASIREFGWTNPVLIDGNGVVRAGHGRILAAQRLGMKRLPCIRLVHLSDEQLRAYVLADNQLALQAGWDEELLKLELAELEVAGFDLPVIGFSDEELGALFDEETITNGNTDPDAVPELPAQAFTRPGDIWRLGRHRIICGDSRDPVNVARLLAGAKPHLMVTDPPYGVEYDPDWRNEDLDADGEPRFGARAIGETLNDDRADWRAAWALFPGDVAYVWHAALHTSVVHDSLAACDFAVRAQIIWAKPGLVISRGHYHWQHEPCWYAVRKGRTGHWVGDRSQTTLWQISHRNDTGHSAQKPVECMLRPMLNHSQEGDAVYEPFSGSGTTIIAAEQSGRCCYASELNPLYVDLAVRRWQEFSGEQAIRDADGVCFDELAET